MNICSIEDCAAPAAKRGWCDRHYLRYRRHGSPLLGGPKRQRYSGCSIEGCDKPHKAHGLCDVHYFRLSKHGDPLGGGAPRGETAGSALRYYREVVLAYDGDDCLLWPFANVKGYANIRIGGRTQLVTRLVCEEEHGPPPANNLDAAHSCGNGHLGCVTRRHLSWKTRLENVADAIQHGTFARGERSGNAKLTEGDVREILSLRGTATQKDLANRFLVSSKTIGKIQLGQRWAHIRADAEPVEY